MSVKGDIKQASSKEDIDQLSRDRLVKVTKRTDKTLRQSDDHVKEIDINTDGKKHQDEDLADFMRSLQAIGQEEKWAIPFSQIKFKQVAPNTSEHFSQIQDWEKLDEGAGGSIFRVTWRGLECVAKTCPLSVGKQVLEDLANEISILSTLRHPNLVMFLGACFEPNRAPILLMEYCADGNLERKLLKLSQQEKKLSKKLAFKYTLDMALALNFLHNCNPPVIHRDLKPSNILLSGDKVKLTDFGLSKFIPKKQIMRERYTLTGETGSYRFMAPEVFNHEEYNEKVDVYSFALIVYWILTGYRPYADIFDPVKAAKIAASGERSPNGKLIKPLSLQKMMERAWSLKPDERPDFSEIVDEVKKQNEATQDSTGCAIM